MLLEICSSYFIFYIFFHLANPVESGVGQHPTTQSSSTGSSSVAQRSSISPSVSISPGVGNAQVNEHRKSFWIQ